LGVTNIVVHWRFSEDVCEVTGSEVSPKAIMRRDSDRVVEIGANRQSYDPSVTLLLKLVLEVVSGCERLVRCY